MNVMIAWQKTQEGIEQGQRGYFQQAISCFEEADVLYRAALLGRSMALPERAVLPAP